LTENDWQLAFQNAPDDAIIDFGVAMDKNVPERNNPLVFADLRGS
jgi:hypothetical protein